MEGTRRREQRSPGSRAAYPPASLGRCPLSIRRAAQSISVAITCKENTTQNQGWSQTRSSINQKLAPRPNSQIAQIWRWKAKHKSARAATTSQRRVREKWLLGSTHAKPTRSKSSALCSHVSSPTRFTNGHFVSDFRSNVRTLQSTVRTSVEVRETDGELLRTCFSRQPSCSTPCTGLTQNSADVQAVGGSIHAGESGSGPSRSRPRILACTPLTTEVTFGRPPQLKAVNTCPSVGVPHLHPAHFVRFSADKLLNNLCGVTKDRCLLHVSS